MFASWADDGMRGDVFHPGGFGLLDEVGTKYLEVSIIHLGHGRDTSLHAQLVFQRIILLLLALLFVHPPILTKSPNV